MAGLRLLTVLAALLVGAGCASSSAPKKSPTPSNRSGGAAVRGKASYYGAKYQGRKTANGETFDKESLTAAHEVISFGTRVRVTNLENGKSVVVRINDRFHPANGVIIDLSEAAFRQIAPLAQGIIPVTIEAVR